MNEKLRITFEVDMEDFISEHNSICKTVDKFFKRKHLDASSEKITDKEISKTVLAIIDGHFPCEIVKVERVNGIKKEDIK